MKPHRSGHTLIERKKQEREREISKQERENERMKGALQSFFFFFPLTPSGA